MIELERLIKYFAEKVSQLDMDSIQESQIINRSGALYVGMKGLKDGV